MTYKGQMFVRDGFDLTGSDLFLITIFITAPIAFFAGELVVGHVVSAGELHSERYSVVVGAVVLRRFLN